MSHPIQVQRPAQNYPVARLNARPADYELNSFFSIQVKNDRRPHLACRKVFPGSPDRVIETGAAGSRTPAAHREAGVWPALDDC